MSGLQILMSPLMGVILVLSAAAQEKPNTPAPVKPNYTGTWKLNLAKSDYGPVPAPESQVYTIEHKEPSIKINVEQKGGARGDIKFSLDLTTDGKEVAAIPESLGSKSAATWDGEVLVIKTNTQYQGSPITIESKYTLSKDGKTLNIAAHIVGSFGEVDTSAVYDKQ